MRGGCRRQHGAGELPAVLPEPTPQGGLAGCRQRMGAHADDPVTAIPADLALLEEEIDALPRPAVGAAAVT